MSESIGSFAKRWAIVNLKVYAAIAAAFSLAFVLFIPTIAITFMTPGVGTGQLDAVALYLQIPWWIAGLSVFFVYFGVFEMPDSGGGESE